MSSDPHSAITAWDDGGQLSSFEDDDDNDINDRFSNYEDNDRFTCVVDVSSASSAASDASGVSEEDVYEQTLAEEVASLAGANDEEVEDEVEVEVDGGRDLDMNRMYENASYHEVLAGKQFRFSPLWVRRALAWCAKHQVSAHCLPRDSKEMIEFMHAVDWPVTDPLLFETLGIKLLSWVGRWITNEKLSPGIIESKVDPKKVRKADWSAVWAAHTEAWIDVEFEFVLGKTDPGVPKGWEGLPPRAPVPRGYKSPATLVNTAAEFLELFDFEVPVQQKIVPVKKKTNSTQKAIQQKTEVPAQKIVAGEKSVPIQQRPAQLLTHKIIDTQRTDNPFQQKTASTKKIVPAQKITTIEKPDPIQKIIQKTIATQQKSNPFQQNPTSVQQKTASSQKIPAQAQKSMVIQETIPGQKMKNNPFQQNRASSQKTVQKKPPATKPVQKSTTTINNSPATKSVPTQKPKHNTIPVQFFKSVLEDGEFIKWITSEDPHAYPLTPLQAVQFTECKDHPQFLGWWKGEIKAKLKRGAIEFYQQQNEQQDEQDEVEYEQDEVEYEQDEVEYEQDEQIKAKSKADAIEKEIEEHEMMPQVQKVVMGKEMEKVVQNNGEKEKVVPGKEKAVVGKGKKTAKTAKTHPVVVVKKVHATRLAARKSAAKENAAKEKKMGAAERMGGGVQVEGGMSFVEV
ncbi:uncharacterized protein MYCGRDRAFT_111756 [Zymoseptoria tritici IPO323]|uniref:Uncharacterized protein n=1 Tax=Zymoseptoria tritici (strain CBS 115943 / IPO323) TaxID=336722 RepID=F9XR42_ZYMTI|nr:uncharacterized protein MYCGRDRAFT_111756 [Zymoseptoria tritici IPO323]EGP82279.1 hypothetical protein MYCGRDRAFT_111756 [Zymoseptoria tritici IPO323]